MEEPVGVMKCFECVEKHARDLEHHLEDIMRTSPVEEAENWEELIRVIRDLRRMAHDRAKGINGADQNRLTAIGGRAGGEGGGQSCSVCSGGNPGLEEEEEDEEDEPQRPMYGNPVPYACRLEEEKVAPKGHFDRRSFRVLCPKCPKSRCSMCPPELACSTRVIVGCPKGEYKAGRCQVGMQTHKIAHGD